MPKRLFFTLFTRSLSTRSYFQFSSDLGRSKGVLLSFFCVLDEYLTLKHTFHDPHSKLLNLAFFDLVNLITLIWHKVTKGLAGYLKISQTWSMSFHRLYFNLMRLICPARPARTDNQKFDLWPDLWSHQWPSHKILQHIRKNQTWSYQIPFLDRESVKQFGR